MPRVMTAAGSAIGAEAAATVADNGGNAVDAALAAVIVSMCTEPGIIAPAAGAFVTVWEPGEEPVTIDGYCEMPGRADPGRIGSGRTEVFMTYGGGMHTNIGYSSVATPGAFAAFDVASTRYGAVPWAEVFGPAVHYTRTGFPLPGVTARYWEHSHEVIFGWHPDSHALVHHADGSIRAQGEILAIPDLADSLELIAKNGAAEFYTGELGRAIADEVHEHGGILSRTDMEQYRAEARNPIRVGLGDWDIATNPVPAIGGAALAALLLLMGERGMDGWTPAEINRLVDAQRAVFTYRAARLEDSAGDLPAAVAELLDAARMGNSGRLMASGSTTHVSAVDSEGRACSITASAGYGSGVLVPGTGIWLNNSLGELELHPDGFHGLTPGTRLMSNMAPTIARKADGEVLAIGSAGADRITTAIAESLLNHMWLDMDLVEAVAHPRVHAEVFEGEPTVAYEQHLPVETNGPVRHFAEKSMYFGGVQAAAWSPEAGLVGTADPRRSGESAAGGPG
ncbi:MAG: gamma-glutamyltransferase [Acidimicrobiia bacterium]|nr:gamma-glutamyltransferase [Acidimicrobiia bacterium]